MTAVWRDNQVVWLDGTITSHQACAMTGCSYRRIDYWTRKGIITPSGQNGRGHGGRRLWTPHDLRAVWVLTQLSIAGRPLVKLRAILETVQRGSGAFLIIDHAQDERYTLGSFQAVEGALLEAAGMVTVMRIPVFEAPS